MNLFQDSFIHNEKHISEYYFNSEKRQLLASEDIFVFSRVVENANELISKINELNIEDSFKKLKFKEIKSKILDCHSLTIALEYYSDFELEIYKINSRINEYSNIGYDKTNASYDTERSERKNKIENEDSEDFVLTIDTETNFISRKSIDEDKMTNTCDKRNMVDFNDGKNIQYYIDKYSARTGANRDYVMNIFSNI